MINERRDFETLDATCLTWPILFYFLYSSIQGICVLKLTLNIVNEKRCLKRITISQKSSSIVVYIVNLQWWSSLSNWDVIEFLIHGWSDSPKDWLDSNWFLLSGIFLPIIILDVNVIKRNLERTNGGWFSRNHELSRIWEFGSQDSCNCFSDGRPQDTWRAQMIYKMVAIRLNSFWNTCY